MLSENHLKITCDGIKSNCIEKKLLMCKRKNQAITNVTIRIRKIKYLFAHANEFV